MLDHVNQGRLSLERFVDLTSHGPNRLFQISRKGRIAEGYDAGRNQVQSLQTVDTRTEEEHEVIREEVSQIQWRRLKGIVLRTEEGETNAPLDVLTGKPDAPTPEKQDGWFSRLVEKIVGTP